LPLSASIHEICLTSGEKNLFSKLGGVERANSFSRNMHPCYPINYDDDAEDNVPLLVSDNVDDAENDLESNDAQVGEEYTHLHPLHNLHNIKYSYHFKLK